MDDPKAISQPTAGRPVDELEAVRVLSGRAHRKTGAIPEETVVRHVLAVTRGADWPVLEEAMEALLRRFSSCRTEGLRVAGRPAEGLALGLYATKSGGKGSRPYRTLLQRLDPPAGSCDCPDFARGSLGLCKHLLAVLDDLHAKPRRLAAAKAEAPEARPGLRWDPVRPLVGAGDWLERVSWTGGKPPKALAGLCKRGAGDAWAVADAEAGRPGRRLALVEALLAALGDGRREPALHTLLRAERGRLRLLEREAGEALGLGRHLRSLKQKLYPYQKTGVERFLASGRLLLADDMGLGKTAQAVASCHALWRGGRVRRGLLLVPAALKPQWLREWRLFTDAPAAVVEGGAAERREAYASCPKGFLIANYEQLIRDLDAVSAWAPDLVVLDEAQRLKNWATKTAVFVKRLRPAWRLVLTGTPMENRIEELASVVEWVDDHALEPKWRLAPWHTTPVDGKAGVGGARNLDTLRARLAPCLLRRLRSDVLGQLPARTDTRVPVAMTPEQASRHDELTQPIANLLRRAAKRPLSQPEFLKLMSLLTTQRIISNGLAQLEFEEVWPQIERITRPGEAALRGLCSPKLLELRELVSQLAVEQERKVVVFSQWRRMLRLAHWATRDILEDRGLKAVFFTGEEGQRRRTQNIVDLHDDPSVRVLFASDAGGVGLNLQRAASACVNLELPWNPAVLEQRIGRIHRLGQKRPIDVYNLVNETGIESRIVALVGDKRAMFTGLFDGGSDEVAFEKSGTFLSRIERIIVPPEVPPAPAGPAEAEAEVVAVAAEAAAADTAETDPAVELEVERTLAASDESRDARRETAPAPVAPAADLPALFSRLSVRTTEAGGLVIEAPPEAAAALSDLFLGMAQLMRQAAGGKG